MRFLRYALLSASLLAGCASGPTIPPSVSIPIATPCVTVAQLPAAPAVRTDLEILALPDYQSVIAVWRDRIVLRDALAERDALLLACAQ